MSRAIDDYVLERLPSGQRLVTERMNNVRSVTLGFWIPVGSRDESIKQAGVTHFIEHLLFKGTVSYSARDIAQIFDTLGGDLNAATSKEYVLVYARVLDEHLPRALEVLLEMILGPTFADLDRERQVILEEIAMYEDSPQDLIHDVFTEAVYGDHSLGHPVLGLRDSIESMSEEDIRAHHAAHFRFGDMVVAAAGNVEHETVKELLLACAPQESASERPVRSNSVSREPRTPFVTKETEQMHVCLGGEGLALSDERRYVLSVLDSVLGGSVSSRLFQEVRENRGLVYSIYSFVNMFQETGLAGVYFGCRPERLPEVIRTVLPELDRVAGAEVPEAELERAKAHLKGRLILGLESTSNRMSRLGRAVLTETEILSLDELAERIDAVSAADVLELAGRIYARDRISVAGIGADEDTFREALPLTGIVP